MTRPFALLVALTLFAAACGDDDTTDVGADPDDTTPPASGNGDGAPDGDTTTTAPLPDGPLGGGPYPIADVTVAYEHPDVGPVEYQIVCLGDTATLIDGPAGVRDQSACLALADGAVQQRLLEGAPTDRACTEIYGGPETAAITGRIDDQPVDTTVDRSDGCGISDWDDLLGDLLPPPRPFE